MAHISPKESRNKKRQSKKSPQRAALNKELFIWGIHPILEALKTNPHHVKEIIVEKGKKGLRLEELLQVAQQKGISVITGQPALEGTDRKAAPSQQEKSQGVSARITLPTLSLDKLLGKFENDATPPFLLALDSIQDPHNLGAIIRSAVAAGVNGLILPKDRSASITSTVINVSSGAAFHLDICRVTNLVSSFKELKKEGIWIVGTAKGSLQPVYETDLTVPVCLVIGSEGKGLRPLVAENCDFLVTIPMKGALDSLNASVAAGIILFETVRQRALQK